MHRACENASSARSLPAAPNAAVRVASPASARIASASASASDDGHEQAGAAVVDDLGQAADGAGDHGPPAFHRLERDHPEALPERGHDDDLGALEDRRDLRDVARGT